MHTRRIRETPRQQILELKKQLSELNARLAEAQKSLRDSEERLSAREKNIADLMVDLNASIKAQEAHLNASFEEREKRRDEQENRDQLRKDALANISPAHTEIVNIRFLLDEDDAETDPEKKKAIRQKIVAALTVAKKRLEQIAESELFKPESQPLSSWATALWPMIAGSAMAYYINTMYSGKTTSGGDPPKAEK